jgi:hypothetical protein
VSFERRLEEARLQLGGFVVNRVHPRGPAAPTAERLRELLAARPELRGYTPDDLARAAGDLERTYGDFQSLAEIDAAQVERLRAIAGEAPIVEVPLFDHDVHDVEGLLLVDRYLIGEGARPQGS